MMSRALRVVGLITVFALAVAADTPPDVSARSLPDRIVLTPGADPAHQMAVAFRADTTETAAEIAVSLDSPGFGARAKPVTGTTVAVPGAVYHHIVFSGLQPDTAYVYRVKGSGGFSEWFSFHTAAAAFKPFRFLYFGDDQHDILSVGSRTIRQAFLNTQAPALALHAGDLTNQHDAKSADDEWGQWTASGGYAYAMVPEVPAIGNHEYVGGKAGWGGDARAPGVFWGASFVLPDNGAESVKATTYTIDYQGVRFIMLDGTSALELGTLKAQTDWLEGVLKQNTSRWTVVMVHQPMFMCSRQNDLPAFQAAWKPVFDKYRVALVLQGHDHCYARWSNPDSAVKATKELQGPVYMISVAGGKMYAINDKTLAKADRIADDTQLYQVIDVAADRLHVQAFTASGRLYDDFSIQRVGAKTRLTTAPNLPPRRVCSGDTGPDGLPCIARAR